LGYFILAIPTSDGLSVVELEATAPPEVIAQERHEENGACFVKTSVQRANGSAGTSHSSRNDDPRYSPEESQDENNEVNDSDNALWSQYEKAVKSRDKVRIEALKDDMDGVLLFVRIYHLTLVVSSVLPPSHIRLAYSPLSSPRSSSQRYRI